MATWKKVVVSGSNISQLNNDANYLTAGTLTQANGFATASFAGTALIADSITGSLNFASSSGQGLTISATAGTDTLTWGLSAVPNASLANSAITIAGTSTSLGGSITAATILGSTGVFSGSAQITGLTNANLSGTAGITNANLANSSITVGSTAISLGSSATTIAGLASVTSTSFTGSLAGLATSASTATITDTTSGTGPYYITFVDGTSGNRSQLVDSSTLTYNATSNTITATSSYANQALSASFASSVPYSGISGVPSGLVSGSSQISYTGLSNIPTGIVSSSVLSAPSTQGQVLLTTNGVAGTTLTLNSLGTTDSPTFLGATLGNVTVGVTTDNTINTSTGNLTINSAGGTTTLDDNVVITGNLSVDGTTTYVNTVDLLVEDPFILLASGSAGDTDGGIIIDRGTYTSGNIAFGYDAATDRWGYQNGLVDTTNALDTTGGGTGASGSFAGIVFTQAAHGATKPITGEFAKEGAIYTATNEDIWIYS